jgi:hypothetical protein
MLVQVENGDAADSHRTMLPVCPLNDRVPAELPVQILLPPVTDPPTEAGVTVTVVEAELAAAHEPLFTTARNWVVSESAPLV